MAAAEVINPTSEHAFGRGHSQGVTMVAQSAPYARYGPAYQYGWESHARYTAKGKSFDEVEAEQQRGRDRRRAASKLSWEHAKDATRDAWQRMEKAVCGRRDD